MTAAPEVTGHTHPMRDALLPHQIVIGQRWHPGESRLYVSCNCRHVAGDVYEPLAERELFLAADMLAVYHAHLKGRQP